MERTMLDIRLFCGSRFVGERCPHRSIMDKYITTRQKERERIDFEKFLYFANKRGMIIMPNKSE